MEKSQIVKGAVGAILLLAAGYLILDNTGVIRKFTPPPPPDSIWFYSVDKKVLVAGPDSIPPITLDGGEAIRAYAFSCNDDCSDGSKLIIGTYEKFTSEAQQKIKDLGVQTYAQLASETFGGGRQVAANPQGPWKDASSRDGTALVAKPVKCPDGKPAKPCNGPGSK